MRLLLITLVLLLAAIYVGSIALNDPGFIIIGYQGHVLRTSFIFFALAIILAGVLLYFLVRLLTNMLTTPKKISGWNHDRLEKKAQKSLSKGFAALTEGNWVSAEQTLSHDAPVSKRLSYMHYLGAAKAAQNQDKINQRDKYLGLAAESAPENDTAVGLTRAELQIEQGQLDEANETLEDLLAKHSKHPRILRLLAKLHESTGNWQSLQLLLKPLKRSGAMKQNDLQELELQTWKGLLNESADNASDLKEVWTRIPKKERQDPELLFLFLEKLTQSSMSADALPIIESTVNKKWDDRLITLYGQAKGKNPAKQLEQAERWLSANKENHFLLTVLGNLCFRNELWGKARNYLSTAIEFGAGPEVYKLLADTMEKVGDEAAAARYRKEGLQLATTKSQALVETETKSKPLDALFDKVGDHAERSE